MTAGGHSTDCSVSVSGSDHELAANESSLQVVTPHHNGSHVVTVMAGGHHNKGYEQYNMRSADQHYSAVLHKAKKIPPAVPSKTVHASLV